MLIDRDDRVINLVEIKWSDKEYILDKNNAEGLRRKNSLFQHYSATKKQVYLTFISPFGTFPNEHSRAVIDQELTLDALFGV